MTAPAPIWLYWDDPAGGRRRPPYLDLCERSIKEHAGPHPVHKVSLATLADWLDDPPPAGLERLVPAHRADVARAHLLYEHGGIWLDTDTVAVQPLSRLLPSGDRTHLAAYVDHTDHVPIGVMSARPGSPVAGQWAAEQRERLARGSNIAWVEIGSDIVRPLLDQPGVEVRDAGQIAPLGWRDWEVFFSRLYPLSRVLSDQRTVVYLYNELMSARLEAVPIESLLRSQTLLGRLLRAGTGSTSPGTEWVIERVAPVGDLHRRIRRRWRYEQKKRARRLEQRAREVPR